MCTVRAGISCALTLATGVLTQFAIVIGIMITQAMGLQLATPRQWRLVLLFSAALSIAQILVAPMMIESPTWLNRHGLLQQKDAAARRIWSSAQVVRGQCILRILSWCMAVLRSYSSDFGQ